MVTCDWSCFTIDPALAVVPMLVGPLQALLALLPALLVSGGGVFLALFKPSTAKQSLKLLWRLKLPLALLAAIVIGAFCLLRAVLPRRGGKISATESSTNSWTMFRGDLARTGTQAGSPAPLSGGLNWAFKGEERAFLSSPAVVGNRVYIAAADKGLFTDRGVIYCLDADTGAEVWRSAPENYRSTFSSPAVSGKYLVCGEGFHDTQDGRVVCLDVTRGGKVLWEFRTANHVESSPCLYNGRAYIGAGDDGYYCFELEPDARGNPRMVWHLTNDRYQDCETCPAAYDGKIFFGLGIDGQAIVCVEADTGRELWRVPTPYPAFGPPTITGGKLIVGMGNGIFTQSAAEIMEKELTRLRELGASEAELAAAEMKLRPGGEVWCIDLAVAADLSKPAASTTGASPVGNGRNRPASVMTNAVAWRFQLSDTVMGAVAAGDDRLYFGSRDGNFYCLSLEGRELARWDAHSPILASPALTATHVYFVTEAGTLRALDRRTWQATWEVTLGRHGPFISSPAIARGRVYVGSMFEGLLCFGSPRTVSSRHKGAWTGPLGGPGNAGNLDHSPLPEHGAVLARWPKPGDEGDAKPPVITAPAAALENFVCVPVAAGPRLGVACLQTDSTNRQSLEEIWSYQTTNGVRLSPALAFASGTEAHRELVPPSLSLFLVDGAMGDAGRHLHRVDMRTGKAVWKFPVSPDASGEFVFARGILIQDTKAALTRVNESGRVEWRQPLGTLRGPLATMDNIAVAALADPPGVVALDLPTGKILWRAALAPTTGLLAAKNRIYFGTTNGLAAHRLADGARVWELREEPLAYAPALAGDTLVFTTSAGEVISLHAPTGRILARTLGAVPGLPPLLARDAALFHSPIGLIWFDAVSGELRRWMATERLGAISSPLIMADSTVYFATEGKGFIRAGRW